MARRFTLIAILILGLVMLVGGITRLVAQDATQEATEMTQEELVARGEYIINIAGCIDCHTPLREEYNVPPDQLTPEQIQILALSRKEAIDTNRLLAGGNRFDLGPVGAVITRNLTPDKATGLGEWTDGEIEAAIRIGVSRDGTRLYPVMPYGNFFNMSRDDMKAVIAYLRSLPAVDNKIVPTGLTGEGVAPVLRGDIPETPPDGSDPVALGAYLVNTIMSCSDCHTPRDPETGAPILDMWLAGGQPFEGPWGIVYGGNITPDDKTGLGSWTDEQIARVLHEGVRIDGRRLIVMPWQFYAAATEEDTAAVIAYLRSLKPVENEVPAPSISDMLLQFVK